MTVVKKDAGNRVTKMTRNSPCDECDGGGCTDCAGTGVFNVLEEAC